METLTHVIIDTNARVLIERSCKAVHNSWICGLIFSANFARICL